MNLRARIAKLESAFRHSWEPIIVFASSRIEGRQLIDEERKRRGLSSAQLVPTICISGSASR
jgi:hypothetical protein